MTQAEVEAVARDLKVKPEEVLQMESRLGGADVSFSATSEDSDESSYVPEDYLASDDDPGKTLEAEDWNERRETRMHAAMEKLDDRSRDILQRRWLSDGDKAGLQELGDEYGVSAERIRQIEAAAMKKLRKAIEEEDAVAA
jgi:RNA polymerase sigma-32 factor